VGDIKRHVNTEIINDMPEDIGNNPDILKEFDQRK